MPEQPVIRVIEVQSGGAAAAAARLLASLGAHVVSVSDPTAPDASLAEADVLVVAANAADLDAPPLALSRLRAEHPALITAAITPFGESGPDRDHQGTDLTAVHAGGLGYGTPPRVTDPEREHPLGLPGDPIAPLAGLVAVIGVLHALAERDLDGRGRHVEVSTQEVVASLMFNSLGSLVDEGAAPGRLASDRPGGRRPLQPCADGWLALMAGRPRHLRAWLELLGPAGHDLLSRFDAGTARAELVGAIDAVADAWAATRTRREITDAAQARHIPIEPVLSPSEVLACPHLAARGFWRDAGGVRVPDHPFGPVGAGDGVRVLANLTPRPPSLAGKGESGRAMGEPVSSAGIRRDTGRPRESSSPFPAREGGRGVRSASLSQVRVVDFGWIFAAPIATRVLAALGADVLRIESPENRDQMWERPFAFRVVNGDKRSARIDAKTPDGLRALRALIREADIVVENFATGVIERLGLGWDELRRENPRLIMLSVSGMGRTGPYAHHVMFGQLAQAYAGITALVGYEDGPARGIEDGGFFSDPVTGYATAAAVLAALRERSVTGRGRRIDISLVEATAWTLVESLLAAQCRNQPLPAGNVHPAMAPHDVYRCAGEDRWIAVAVRDDAEWRSLCEVIGRPGLGDHPAFATCAARQRRRLGLRTLVESWTRQRTPEEAVAGLQAAGIPAAPSRTMADLAADPHLGSRGFFIRDPETGAILTQSLPWRLHPAAAVRYGSAPAYGADTEAALIATGPVPFGTV